MQKKVLGYLLATIGFGGMALAGFIFVTGTGGRGHLLEVTSFMIVGAVCFFAGINYVYESRSVRMEGRRSEADTEEIPQIQQQWRTIQVSKPVPAPTLASNNA